MGSKEGRVVELLIRLANVTRFQIEGKKYASAATVFSGFVYGDYKGGPLSEMVPQEMVDRLTRDCEKTHQLVEQLTRDCETKHQLYKAKAKAREMGISEVKGGR